MTFGGSGCGRRSALALRLAWGALALLGCNSMLGIERAELVVPENGDAGVGVGSEPCDRPGESYCVGRRRLVCGPNRRLARSDECASPAHCEQAAIARGESCAACVATCQGNVLSGCRDGVSASALDCGTDFCDTTGVGQCLPAACSAGDVACANGRFLRCDDGMTFSVAATCASAALCSTEQGGCLEAECEPGQRRCTEAALEACGDDRGHWVRSELCASAELCDAAAGVCRPPACSVGDAECVGATLRSCRPDRTGFTEQACESDELCDGATGVCQRPSCQAGMGLCEGSILFRCDGDPPRFERIDTCGNAALCDAARAQCLVCVPDSQRCSDDGRAEIVCDAAGQTESVRACPMTLGLLGRCLDGACVAL